MTIISRFKIATLETRTVWRTEEHTQRIGRNNTESMIAMSVPEISRIRGLLVGIISKNDDLLMDP